jgi:hypothetical protein
MGNRETQKTLGTRHRKHWAQDTERGQTKQQTQHRIKNVDIKFSAHDAFLE